jgi:hypothetical protein
MAEEINDFGGSAVDVDEDFLGWGIARSEGGEGVVELGGAVAGGDGGGQRHAEARRGGRRGGG